MGKHTVQRYMTVGPVVISSGRPIADARRVMRERGIRHLPVVDDGKLVGMLSQRDVYLVESLKGVDPSADPVGEAMSADPYAVPPDAPLDRVAEAMATRKIGSAVVVDRGAVIGVFTTVDALRALSDLVRRRRDRPAEERDPGDGRGRAGE